MSAEVEADAERQVLSLVEEAVLAGLAPDDVCAAWPQLAPAVRERWRQYRELEAEVEVLFPSSDPPLRGGPAHRWADLPEIPGYAVESVLGRGGAGVVYRARHLRLDRTVAVKMLLSGPHAGRIELARFLSEARAVAGLRHPNVVQVHDVGELDGRPYFTTEFLDGGSLAERQAGVPWPPARAADLVATLADAVEAFHRHGIVHRDLKPGNVLLTTDGVPKISDFGLARRVDGRGNLTVFGTAVGTPGYMAPEQASGRVDGVGPAVDVYALGVILQELLSGRTPVPGEPTGPLPVTVRVPRDLRTICLKCTAAEPAERYATAAALADDLRRFGRGEPVVARPAALPTVVVKWVRRRPAAALATATTAAVILAAVGWGGWLVSNRAATRAAVERDLNEAVADQRRSAWPQASAALDRAVVQLGDGGPADLRERLDRARRDSALVARFDGIRLAHAALYRDERTPGSFNADFAAAFHDAGLADPAEDPAVVAARLRASNVRTALVAAVDEWTFWDPDPVHGRWLWDVRCRADPDPTGWQDRARDPATWRTPAAMADLVRTAPVATRSVPLLLAVARHLDHVGQDATPFLLAVERAHPDDLWANIAAGEAMVVRRDWPEAIRYFQAAVASRPDGAFSHHDLGYAMFGAGRYPEAMSEFREALRLDPRSAHSHGYLGLALYRTGSVEAGLNELREAVRLWPTDGYFQFGLADAIAHAGHDDEALPLYRRAVILTPKDPLALRALRNCLVRHQLWDEACDVWRSELDLNPPGQNVWDGYAELCLFRGRDADYRDVCRRLLDRYGASPAPAVRERVGRACLLSPTLDPDQLRRATATVDRAVTGARGHLDRVLFAKALADYRAGDYAAAASIAQGPAAHVLGPAPGLLAAMSQWQLGHPDMARATLASAVAAFDWSPSGTVDGQTWMYHVLRKEAEELILQR